MLSARLRSAYIDAVPQELRLRDRWVLEPQLKTAQTLKGQVTSSSDPSSWLPFSIAAACYRSGLEIGFVAGDSVTIVRGELSSLLPNAGIMWSWKSTIARRQGEYVNWIYIGGDISNPDQTPCRNKVSPSFTIGFDNLAFNVVGPPAGFATQPMPYDRHNLPIQRRSLLEALQLEHGNLQQKVKQMQARLAELKR